MVEEKEKEKELNPFNIEFIEIPYKEMKDYLDKLKNRVK